MVLFVILFVAAATLLIGPNVSGRRAPGTGLRAAELAGVPVGATIVRTYVLSGFSGEGSLGMGDDDQQPSTAVRAGRRSRADGGATSA